MKKTYKLMLVAGVSVMTIGLAGSAFAFHGGGVAHCDGCHSMHNSADNPRAGSAIAADLMKGSDPSSTCLNCHSGNNGYHIASSGGQNVSQGGDFFWVGASGSYDYYNRGLRTSDAEGHGHNIVASDFGFAADTTNTQAPGGSVSSATLGCTSCHDPHGQVDGGTDDGAAPISVSGSYGAADPADGSIHGNFRLLGDTGYKNFTTADAPVATSKNGNRTTGSYGAWTNYGDGMSDWCLSCHGGFKDNDNMHPVDVNVPATYNSYVKTGDFTGVVSTAFDALVPFERSITDGSDAAMLADSAMGADGVDDVVMCLTCHRAHASAFDNALRWDGYTSEYIAESAVFQAITGFSYAGPADPITGDPTTITVAATIPDAKPYYANDAAVDVVATYGEYQRSLCNKCHAKD